MFGVDLLDPSESAEVVLKDVSIVFVEILQDESVGDDQSFGNARGGARQGAFDEHFVPVDQMRPIAHELRRATRVLKGDERETMVGLDKTNKLRMHRTTTKAMNAYIVFLVSIDR